MLKKILSTLLVLFLLFGLGIPGSAALTQDNSTTAASSRFPQLSPAAKMAPELAGAPSNQPLKVLIYLNEQVNAEQVAVEAISAAVSRNTPAGELKLTGRVALIRALQETAQRTQLGLLRFLEKAKAEGAVQSYQSFWISNLVVVSTDKATLEIIASRPEVAKITPSKTVTLDDVLPLSTPETADTPVLNEIGWNISMVRAPEVWAMGFLGQGVTVCNIDTGVDWTHPALSRKWLAYNPLTPTVPNPALLPYAWFDATVAQSPVPVDTNGHGTHTMGTMVASDPQGGHQYGMAPDAVWIAADAFTTNSGTDEDLLECGQWVLAPGGNPARAPDVVSNSWGSDEGSDTWYQATVKAWRAAGIFPSWSIGNSGPAAGSAGEPGAYPESFSSGMVDRYGVLNSQSSRGPSFWGEIKPEVVAPGVGNPSTIPGGGYSSGYTGTSMACPHSSGAAALLLNIDPTLTPTEIETLLMDAATPKTSPQYPDHPNNGYGWGLLDIYSAALELVEAGTVSGRVLLPGDDLIPPTATHTPPPMIFEGRSAPVSVHAMDNVSVVSVEVFARPTGVGEYTYIPLALTSGGIKDGIWTGAFPAHLLIAQFGLQYYIRVNDYGNNMIQLPASGVTYQVTVSAGLHPGWSENFDGAAIPVGWDHFGGGGKADCWQWGAPLAPKTAHSPPNVFATNLSGLYPNNAESWLVLPPLDLTGLTKARLAWWQWWQIENSYDHGYVAVSTNGTDFTTLRDYTGPLGSPEHPWSPEILDLTPYVGGKIFLAFILSTDSSMQMKGWLLDDFSLVGPNPGPPGRPTGLVGLYVPLSGVQLAFQAPPDLDLEYFGVYRSTTSGSGYALTATLPFTGSPTCAFLDMHPVGGATNYYAIKAFDMGGNASGYSNEAGVLVPALPATIIYEDFNGPWIPSGWTVTATNPDPAKTIGLPWMRNDQLPSGGRANLTGGSGTCAAADIDKAGSGKAIVTSLLTPTFSMAPTLSSGLAYTGALLKLKATYNGFASGQQATIDISTNGGGNWTNLLHWSAVSITATTLTIPLNDYLGQAACQIRFTYTATTWAYYWQVDDVQVVGLTALDQAPATSPPSLIGGPVLGEDEDKAKAPPALSALTLSRPSLPQSPSPAPNSLPADANVTILESSATTHTNPATGAYSLFHEIGNYSLQATSYGYYPQTASVTILPSRTTIQNFQLTAVPTAALQGTVTDFQSGLPIKGATLYVLEDAHILSTTTSADGHYHLTLLAPANPTGYTLRICAPTYYSQDIQVQVNAGAATTQNVPLRPFIGVPGELAYDNGNPVNAYAYFDAGNGWAVRMSPIGGAAMLQALKFMFWGPDWPLPGGTAMQWAIYGDDDGQPGALLAGPFDGAALRTTPPSWTTIDVSSLGLVMSGDFYVAYIQTVPDPDSPGLAVDDGEDTGRNWQLAGGSWSPAYDGLAGNLMIRAEVLYPVNAPVIASPLDGAITNQPSQIIEGAGAPVIEIQLFKNSTLTATMLSSLSGHFSFPVTLLPGKNTYHVWARVGLRHSDPSNRVTVTLHQTPPQLAVNAPLENTATNKDAIAVSGSADSLYFDRLSINGATVSTSTGPFNHFQLLGPTDGTYTLTVTALDKAGNETTIVRLVIRDTAPPLISGMVPATNQNNLRPGDLVPVSFTSEPGLASAAFLVSIPGATTHSWTPLSETATGHYAAQWSIPDGFGAKGAQVMFRAFDRAGNSSEANAPGLLYVIPSGPVDRLSLSPAAATILAGSTQTYTATAYDAIGNIWDVTALASYTISPNGAVAANTVTATQAGPHTVTVSYAGKSATATLTVTHSATADHLSLSPATATILAGASQTYTATAYDRYGNRWDITTLASYSITPSAAGSWSANLYTAQVAGLWTVTASCGGKTVTASLQVIPAALDHFAFAVIPSPQTAGTPFSVQITAHDPYNNTKTNYTGPATLSGFANSVSPTSIPFANGIANSTLTITKAMAGVLTIASGSASSDSNTFTVTPSGYVDRLSLSPATATILAGASQTYTATAYDSYGNSWDITSLATYVVSPDGAVIANTITATHAGLHTVTGSYTGKSATASLYVTPSGSVDRLSLSPATATILAGASQTYTATAYDSYGNSWDITSLATYAISPDGAVIANTVTASYGGPHTVTASYGGKTATATLYVISFIEVTLSLDSGWNLFSLPVVTGLTPGQIFAGLPAGWILYGWNATTGAYIPKAGIPTIEVGKGYWIKVSAPTAVIVTGELLREAPSFDLIAGWNLIGSSSASGLPWNQLTVKKDGLTKTMAEAYTAGWITNMLWLYDGGSYENLWGEELPSGFGLWLKANVPCQILFPKPIP